MGWRKNSVGLGVALWIAGCGGFGDPISSSEGEPPTWDGEIQDLLADNCTGCHSTPQPVGVPDYFELDKYSIDDRPNGLSGAADMRALILNRAVHLSPTSMPPAGPMIPANIALLQAWIEADAPRS